MSRRHNSFNTKNTKILSSFVFLQAGKMKEERETIDQFSQLRIEQIMNEKPTGITANKKTREFTITWNDNHSSVYPFELLRAACPCASCRGGHENMKSEPDAEVFDIKLGDTPSTRISNVVAVGSYALTIVWEDGHDYGIYNWHYLRALCPCPEDRAKYRKK